ncbi:MAG TPA: ATP-binding protein [Anaeromyxobacter sp.]|nr:ATP-binding protein [Anaeromyxobacter sp.]
MTPPEKKRPTEDDRLAECMEIIIALAAGEAPTRAIIVGDGSILDGIGTGLNMMADEIAERRAKEQEYQRRLIEAERLAAIGQLAAGVAHEINNPAGFLLSNLTVAQQYAERLAAVLERVRGALGKHPAARGDAEKELREGEADTVLEDLGRICLENLEGIRRIAAISRTLLGFSGVHSDQIAKVRLDRVAEEACTVVGAEIRRRSRLTRRLEPVPAIAADHGKLVQVATNLLLNAAQAIPEGAPQEHEVLVSTALERSKVVLRVRDTGCGIPVEVQSRVFEPFFTTKPRGVGTGLGLPISAEIVRLHGGEIRFSSVPGQGSTFEVVLPEETGLESLEARPSPKSAPPLERRLRVLMVDDEPALLAAYERILGSGYDLTVAAGGREAIEALDRRQDWDAIICDLLMPGTDGQKVLSHVRSRYPALAERMAFCTGGAVRPLENAEEIPVLAKPLEREELERNIRRLSGL